MHVDREGGTEWFCSRSMHLKYKGNEIVPVIRVERFAAKVYIVNLDNPLEVLFGGRGAGGLSLKTTNVRKKKTLLHSYNRSRVAPVPYTNAVDIGVLPYFAGLYLAFLDRES